MTVAIAVIAVLAVFILIILAAAIRILREYERGVIFRLGRLIAQKGPGLILLIPFIDQMVRIDLRTITLNVPPQEVITKDNVTVRVNAVAYFRVLDPNKAVTEVENFLLATSQIAQTTLRSVLGKAELDALLSERERLNLELQQIIDEQTEPWGIKVSTVEVKDVELPADMQKAMSRQAEAERERRAKIIAADGEFQAAEKLSQAAEHHQREPGDAAAALPADAGRDRRQQHLDDRLPAADRPDQAADRAARPAERPDPGDAAPAARVLTSPEVRIDQLTGLRAILAPGRAERPDAFDPTPGRAASRRGRALSVLRGARGPDPARGLGRPPGGRRRTRPGWRTRSVPNLYPVLGAEAEQRATSDELRANESGITSSIDPARRRQPRCARAVSLAAGDRGARGDRQLPRARDLARRARRRTVRVGGVGLARADARPRATPPIVHSDRQRGPGRRRLARALPRPALRARLRARRDRPRARARRPPTTSGRWAATCSRTSRRRGGPPPRAARRGRRRGRC